MTRTALTLAFVRGAHTAIYIMMSASVFALLYASLTGATGWWLWVALTLVLIEVAVFAGSGMKCPLTAVAVKLGANRGDDTFLPERLTRYTLVFFGPLIIVSLALLMVRWWAPN